MNGWRPLGVSKFEDLVGRSEWLYALEGQTAKQQGLDLSPILYQPKVPATGHALARNQPPADLGVA